MNSTVPAIAEPEKSTKEQIRDAAIDLFSEKGYDAVSIREIARTVGIRESSIYNHYKGKEDIMDSIMSFFIAELARVDPDEMPIEVALEKYGPEGFMINGGKAYMARMKEPRVKKIWRLISIELYRNEKIRDFFKNNMLGFAIQTWEQTFTKMMELGYIRQYDPKVLANEFFYYCIYLYFDYFVLRYAETSYDAFFDNIMDDMKGHIGFIFEAVRIPEKEKRKQSMVKHLPGEI